MSRRLCSRTSVTELKLKPCSPVETPALLGASEFLVGRGSDLLQLVTVTVLDTFLLQTEGGKTEKMAKTGNRDLVAR